MRIVYTPHALKRLQKRGISKEQVEKTLAEPEITLPTQNPRRGRVKKKFGDKYLDVIFERRPNYTLIITVVWPEKKEK